MLIKVYENPFMPLWDTQKAFAIIDAKLAIVAAYSENDCKNIVFP